MTALEYKITASTANELHVALQEAAGPDLSLIPADDLLKALRAKVRKDGLVVKVVPFDSRPTFPDAEDPLFAYWMITTKDGRVVEVSDGDDNLATAKNMDQLAAALSHYQRQALPAAEPVIQA